MGLLWKQFQMIHLLPDFPVFICLRFFHISYQTLYTYHICSCLIKQLQILQKCVFPSKKTGEKVWWWNYWRSRYWIQCPLYRLCVTISSRISQSYLGKNNTVTWLCYYLPDVSWWTQALLYFQYAFVLWLFQSSYTFADSFLSDSATSSSFMIYVQCVLVTHNFTPEIITGENIFIHDHITGNTYHVIWNWIRKPNVFQNTAIIY